MQILYIKLNIRFVENITITIIVLYAEHELHLDVSDLVTGVDDQPPPIKLRTTTLVPSTSTPEPIIHVGTTNVTVQLGGTALLHCEIANLTEKMVSICYMV